MPACIVARTADGVRQMMKSFGADRAIQWKCPAIARAAGCASDSAMRSGSGTSNGTFSICAW